MNAASRGLGYALLWLLVCGATVLAWWLTLGARAVAAHRQLAVEVTQLESHVRVLEVTASQEAAFRSEAGAVEAERAAIRRALPAAADEQAFVLTFDSRARDLSLMVSSLRWEKRQRRDLYTAAPLTLEVRGVFEGALLFASKMATGDPLVAVQSIELKRGPVSTLTLKAEALSAPDL